MKLTSVNQSFTVKNAKKYGYFSRKSGVFLKKVHSFMQLCFSIYFVKYQRTTTHNYYGLDNS